MQKRTAKSDLVQNLGQILQNITINADLRNMIQIWIKEGTPIQDIYEGLIKAFTLPELTTLSQFASAQNSQADAIICVAAKRAYRKTYQQINK